MKVSIGMRIQEGPFGGANQFARSLAEYLKQHGHQVCFELKDPDIDLILLTDPRPELPSNAFTVKDIVRYLKTVNGRAVVAHRINECDERKGTDFMNKILVDANRSCADHTIFIASWLKALFVRLGIPGEESSVLLNGADTDIFNAQGYRPWKRFEKLRIVTHHWGGNWNKGFDIYAKLDDMMGEEPFRNQIIFTYIGNIPDGVRLKYTQCFAPMHGKELAEYIRRNHVYVTGTLNEPAGMHHIEGALCGLPLLYRNSGALPEYCGTHGIMFEGDQDFPQALERMMTDYDQYAVRMASYPHTADVMCRGYLNLFIDLVSRREQLISRREKK